MLRYRSNKIYTGYLSGNYKILKKKVKEKDLMSIDWKTHY